MDEPTIIKQVLAGNKEAFSEIIRAYEKRVYGIIYQIVRNPQDAEDIMQETFLTAYQKLSEFRGDSSLFTWLGAIAYNNVRQYLRRRRLNQWLSLEPEVFTLEDKSITPERTEKEELKKTLQEALMKLPVKLRSALILYGVEGLEHQAIAEIMDCPVGTVWSYLSRAKARLRKLLKDRTIDFTD